MLRPSRRARRATLLALGLLLAPMSGCFGPFPAVHAIHEFNDGPRNKWVKELVFLGFIILPVYEIGILIDVIILNPIEFFDL